MIDQATPNVGDVWFNSAVGASATIVRIDASSRTVNVVFRWNDDNHLDYCELDGFLKRFTQIVPDELPNGGWLVGIRPAAAEAPAAEEVTAHLAAGTFSEATVVEGAAVRTIPFAEPVQWPGGWATVKVYDDKVTITPLPTKTVQPGAVDPDPTVALRAQLADVARYTNETATVLHGALGWEQIIDPSTPVDCTRAALELVYQFRAQRAEVRRLHEQIAALLPWARGGAAVADECDYMWEFPHADDLDRQRDEARDLLTWIARGKFGEVPHV